MSGSDSFKSLAAMLVAASLHEPVDHFVGCRGKRIRAALLNLSYRIAGGRGEVGVGDVLDVTVGVGASGKERRLRQRGR